MNLRSFIDSFREDAGDTVKPYFWSDISITNHLNEAEEEACVRARLLFDNDPALYEFDFAPGETTVILNPLVLSIERADVVGADGVSSILEATDRQEMDYIQSDWRTAEIRPSCFIHDDRTLTLNSALDGAYTMKAEGYRLPKKAMSADADTPEIGNVHHRHLLHWVKHRAYGKTDAETFDKDKSLAGLIAFEQYFGPRPDASIRRKQAANRPHRNKCVW